MPGVMSWEEMNWLFPDFEETGLIYHGSQPGNLVSIFRNGLARGYNIPADGHETIYNAHYRHRPGFIPRWVDPGKCIFGFMNRERQGGLEDIVDGKVNQVAIGIEADDQVRRRTWAACVQFSNLVDSPKEAGYLDTKEREAFFMERMEPVACEAYWRTSMSFEENLKIRLDHLYTMQGYHELLICCAIRPELLSLQGFRVQGSGQVREVLRRDLPGVFRSAEDKLRNNAGIDLELEEIAGFCGRAG